MYVYECVFFFSSRRRHTRCALVTGVQTCALPILNRGKGVTRTLHKAWLLLLALVLAALAMPAFALGLGQITVKSERGEPLLAEIAIISSDPGELENLQARLASPETFARVGLEPP